MAQKLCSDPCHLCICSCVLQLPSRAGRDGGAGPAVPGARKPALVWFRNDLRLHDHEALATANQEATSVVPVYCFDPREYGKVGRGGNSLH